MSYGTSPYGYLSADFWDGATGPEIARLGGAPAQLLALYLTSNRFANMIGLYPIDVAQMRAGVRTLTVPRIRTALDVLAAVHFADYDEATKHVWVREMAKYRLRIDEPLKRIDNRAVGARRIYEALRPNPFLGAFFDRYRAWLPLTKRRTYDPPLVAAARDTTTPSPLRRGSEAPSKPSTGTGTGTGTERSGGAQFAPAPASPKAWLTLFDELHRHRFGTKAAITGAKDAALLAKLGRQRQGDPISVEDLIRAFFESHDPFIAQAGFTVGVLSSQVGKLLQTLSRTAGEGERPPPGSWREECRRLHGGRCTNVTFHAASLAAGAEKARA